jgi:IS605 OrfB family transposase
MVCKMHKYKLYPTPEQVRLLGLTLLHCRHVYNAALEQRRTRRRRAVRLLSKAHQHVRRVRQDFHHKTAFTLVRHYDTIFHEDLQTANMVQNSHRAKSISDAGWSGFLSILTFKAAAHAPAEHHHPMKMRLGRFTKGS